MHEQTTTGGAVVAGVTRGSLSAETPSDCIPILNTHALRMTPELLAEIAFQQAAMLASRLSSREQAAFWRQVMKLAGDLPHAGEFTYSK